MSKSIPDIVPDPELLLSIEPEELGGVILEHLNSLDPRETEELNRFNFSIESWIGVYSTGYNGDDIKKVLMEGWVWLEREGFLAPSPGTQGGYFFVTRRGKRAPVTQTLPLTVRLMYFQEGCCIQMSR